MRMPTGVKRPAGNVKRMEVQSASIVSRCLATEMELGAWIKCGRSRRRKPTRQAVVLAVVMWGRDGRRNAYRRQCALFQLENRLLSVLLPAVTCFH